MIRYIIRVALLLTILAAPAAAQGDGPLTFPLPPSHVTVLKPIYLNLSSNTSPSQDVILLDGIIDIDAVVLAIVQTFGIGGHLAQLFVIPGWGSLDGQVNVGNQSVPILDNSGLMDASVNLRLGLVNAPAMNLLQYAQWTPKVTVSALFGVGIPIGQYDQARRVNVGSNRWAFRFSAPVVIPLSRNRKKPAWWEITPSLFLYTNNNAPFGGSVKTQQAMFKAESHASLFFTPRIWGAVDLGYEYGGETAIDGLSDDNELNQLSAGGTLGYVIAAPLIAEASYGRIWFNDQDGYLIRAALKLIIPSKGNRELVKKAQEAAAQAPAPSSPE